MDLSHFSDNFPGLIIPSELLISHLHGFSNFIFQKKKKNLPPFRRFLGRCIRVFFTKTTFVLWLRNRLDVVTDVTGVSFSDVVRCNVPSGNCSLSAKLALVIQLLETNYHCKLEACYPRRLFLTSIRMSMARQVGNRRRPVYAVPGTSCFCYSNHVPHHDDRGNYALACQV